MNHLPTIMEHGLVADTLVQESGDLVHEAGDPGIKEHRRRRPVDAPPQGVVADYVPFYFAPCSPMMFRIHMGGVPEYGGSDHDLAYLVTSIERVVDAGEQVVVSDRNAAKAIARFSSDPSEWDELVDWSLMRATYWNDIPEYPDRRERRMAECLVYRSVSWSAITRVVVHDEMHRSTAAAAIASGGGGVPVTVRRDWYF